MESRAAMPDRRLVLLLPSAFSTSLGIGIVNLGMLFLVKGAHGAGAETIGWFTALWCVAYFAGCVLLRPLTRVLSATASMTIACALIAGLLSAYALFPSLAMAFAVNGAYGFSCALFWPRAMGWLASGLEGNAISRAYGAYNISWSVAGVAAPYIAGALSERLLASPVYLGIGIFGANALYVAIASIRIPSPALRAPAGGGAPAEGSAAEAGDADHSTPLRFPAWAGVFAAYVMYAVFSNIFPVFAKDDLGLGESAIGLILLGRATTLAAAFWIIGRMGSWQFKRKLILTPVAALLALDLAFVAVGGVAGIVAGIAVSGVLVAFAYSMSVFYGASGALDRDKRMSVHEAVLTAGQVVGSVAGGAIYQRLSWAWVFILGALILAGCMAAQLAMLRKR